jgi:hypothetical protein
MYYVQDFARLGRSVPEPQSLENVSDEELIGRPYKKADLLLALKNAEMRKKFCKDSLEWKDRLPEKFTPNCGLFRLWEEKFIEHLSHLPGSSGVPLSYVIRDDNVVQVLNAHDHLHSLILLAPHYGSYYIKDTTDVYNIIMKCIPREIIDDCTNDESCFGDGRLMMQRLRTAYVNDVGGEAEKLKENDLYDDLPNAVAGLEPTSVRSTTGTELRGETIASNPGVDTQVIPAIAPERVVSATGVESITSQTTTATVAAIQMEQAEVVGAARTDERLTKSAKRRRRSIERALLLAHEQTLVEQQRIVVREQQLAVEAERLETLRLQRNVDLLRTQQPIPLHQWNRMSAEERRDIWEHYENNVAMHQADNAGRGGGFSHRRHSDRY